MSNRGTIRPRPLRLAVLVGATAAALATGAATGCGSDEAASGEGPAAALKEATGVDWIVSTDPATNAVVFAAPRGGAYAVPGADRDLAAATLAFLDTNKAVFKMNAPRDELVLERVDRDGDGGRHVRFIQRTHGVPVAGGVWNAHFDASARVSSMSGNYAIGANALPTTPRISGPAAATAAKTEAQRLAPRTRLGSLVTTTPVLELFRVDASAPARLAWRTAVGGRSRGGFLNLQVAVDAESGAILRTWSGVHTMRTTARAPQSHPPFSEDAPDVGFLVSDETPARLDAVGPNGVRMIVGQASDFDTAAQTDPPADPPAIVSLTSNPWTDAVRPEGAPGVAQANTETFLGFLADHRWGPDDQPYRSYDGVGGRVLSIMNFNYDGQVDDQAACDADINDGGATDGGVPASCEDRTGAENNAAFIGPPYNMMVYGDGADDPVLGVRWYPFSTGLDVVAHELGHGVTASTSRLNYVAGTTPAALNEHMSDVFASLMDHRRGASDKDAFTLAEDNNGNRTPLRSMWNPRIHEDVPLTLEELENQPTDVRADDGTVIEQNRSQHRDSNLPSYAFYLLTHGDTHQTTRVKVPCGIGWAATDRLYWRLETTYIEPFETYSQFALHGLAAARELGIPLRPVACAWVAVGVLTDAQAAEWGATCEREGEDGGTADASDNMLVTEPAQLVECEVSLAGPGKTLTP